MLPAPPVHGQDVEERGEDDGAGAPGGPPQGTRQGGRHQDEQNPYRLKQHFLRLRLRLSVDSRL